MEDLFVTIEMFCPVETPVEKEPGRAVLCFPACIPFRVSRRKLFCWPGHRRKDGPVQGVSRHQGWTRGSGKCKGLVYFCFITSHEPCHANRADLFMKPFPFLPGNASDRRAPGTSALRPAHLVVPWQDTRGRSTPEPGSADGNRGPFPPVSRPVQPVARESGVREHRGESGRCRRRTPGSSPQCLQGPGRSHGLLVRSRDDMQTSCRFRVSHDA